MPNIELPLRGPAGFAGAVALSVSVLYYAYNGMCMGEYGTRYLMTGDAANPFVYSCAVYDYSKYFPGFEEKTDSFRNFR